MKKIALFGIFSILSTALFAQTPNDIKMFPLAEEGMEQKVIRLEPKENEEDFMVEVMIGKKSKVDTCNRYFLGGNLEENNLDGWGYNYYTFSTNGMIGGTLMGCMDNKQVEKVVYAPSEKVRYNSKLPIVIYAPKDYQVDYRIWSASNEVNTVK